MIKIKVLIGLIISLLVMFLTVGETNESEGCCPRMRSRKTAEAPAQEGEEPSAKKDDKQSSGEEKKEPSIGEKKSSIGEAPAIDGGGLLDSGGSGGTSGGGSPAPGVSRPPLGPGIQPLIQSLKAGGSSLVGVVDPWEAWWTRNREYYLNVHKPSEWFKVQAGEGGTQSVTRLEIYNKLMDILAKTLGDKDQFLAFRAAISLGMAKDELATTVLKKAYASETKFFLRNNIIFALGLTGDHSCADIIMGVLSNKSEAVLSRCYAAAALGYINTPAVIALLQETVSKKGDAELICCATLSLGNLGDNSSIPILVNLLASAKEHEAKRDNRIRTHAALALARIGNASSFPEIRKSILSELANAANDKETDVRASVAIALGLMKAAESKDTLMVLLKDDRGIVRGLAAVSLAQAGVKDIYDVLLKALQKSGDEDRGLIMMALGFLGDERIKPKFREIVQSRREKTLTKSAAAISLGLLKDKESIPALAEIMSKRGDPDMRSYVILALGMIGDSKAIEPLKREWEAAAQRSDQRNISNIGYTNLAIALTLLGKRDDLVIPQLMKHCKSNVSSEVMKIYALHTLGIIGNRESAQAFVDASAGESGSVELRKSIATGIGFMIDKNPAPEINKFTANNYFDIYMIIMDHILPIPVW